MYSQLSLLNSWRLGQPWGQKEETEGRCRCLFVIFPRQLSGLAQPILQTGSLDALAPGSWQVKSKCTPALPANGSPAPGGEPGRQMASGPVLVAAQGGWEVWLHVEAAGGSLLWRKFQSLNRTWEVHSWSSGLEDSASKCLFPAQSSASWLSLRPFWDLVGLFQGGCKQVSTHPKSVADGKEAERLDPGGGGQWAVFWPAQWRAWGRHPQKVQVGQHITSTPHPTDPQLSHCESQGSQPCLERFTSASPMVPCNQLWPHLSSD